MISSAILVGGQSKRMGRDKAWLTVNGVPMVLRIARVLRHVTGAAPILIAKYPKKYDHLGLKVVRDVFPVQCSLAGIHSALSHSATRRMLITTCDQPFLAPKILRELIATPGDVVVCEVERKLEPFPGVYSREMIEALENSFDDGVLSIQENLFAIGFPHILDEAHVRRLDPDIATFRNLNTPEELRRGRRQARAHAISS